MRESGCSGDHAWHQWLHLLSYAGTGCCGSKNGRCDKKDKSETNYFIYVYDDYLCFSINCEEFDRFYRSDDKRAKEEDTTYKSNIAYGPLLQGYAICGGYTDAMQLFLDKMSIKNFKVASKDHIWNAVYLDNKWYNLDLTWDDPVTTNMIDVLDHSYFLIDTDKLLELDTTQHTFNIENSKELKNS